MKIGLYGLPCSGKSYVLEKVKETGIISVEEGSSLLFAIDPQFRSRTNVEQAQIRTQLAENLQKKETSFMMCGHYSFVNEIVFTQKDGNLYDVFFYLYVAPQCLFQRMNQSEKNKKYVENLTVDEVEQWQQGEIIGLRHYCHEHNKDFYVLDAPTSMVHDSLHTPLSFLKEVLEGLSGFQFAQQFSQSFSPPFPNIVLCDGDGTLLTVDSSFHFLQYKTQIFQGNFYTGYQQWKQWQEFSEITAENVDTSWISQGNFLPIRSSLLELFPPHTPVMILTAGNPLLWEKIVQALQKNYPHIMWTLCSGKEMSGDCKYFICKLLQEQGIHVTAFGDSGNDAFMLEQADEGYLVAKNSGHFSSSLSQTTLNTLKKGGIHYVYSQ